MKIYVIRNPNGTMCFTTKTNLEAIELEIDQQLFITLKKDLPFYQLDKGKIRFNPAMENIYPFLTSNEKIQSLKEELSSSDYKVIKCIEAQLVNGKPPYDIIQLHKERERIRANIRVLEGM